MTESLKLSTSEKKYPIRLRDGHSFIAKRAGLDAFLAVCICGWEAVVDVDDVTDGDLLGWVKRIHDASVFVVPKKGLQMLRTFDILSSDYQGQNEMLDRVKAHTAEDALTIWRVTCQDKHSPKPTFRDITAIEEGV